MKVLLTSASTGAGHTRAAQAIENALRLSHPGLEVVHLNVLDYMTKPFRLLYEGGYNFVAKENPTLWGVLYNMSNNALANRVVLPPMNCLQRLNAGHFLRYVSRLAPDKIVTTHFLIPQLLTCLFNPRERKFQLETVITDYGLHDYWVNSMVQRYYVAHEGLVDELSVAGVPKSKTLVTGIPIDPVFLKEVNSERVRQLMNLNAEVPTILVLSGGMGFGAMDQTVQALFSVPGPVQLIAVAGKNEPLKKKLDALNAPSSVKLINLGFVTNMNELLSVSDLVISKAGGLTTSECLAKGVPMILFGPLPGQEDKNVEYLESKGAGVLAKTLDQVVKITTELMENDSHLQKMKESALSAARGQAAFTIADSLASISS